VPIHAGTPAISGRALPALTNSPDRLLHTLKRQPDVAAPLGADQALDEIAGQLQDIIRNHGPRAVALYVGTGMNKSVPAFALADSFYGGYRLENALRRQYDRPTRQTDRQRPTRYWDGPTPSFR